MTTRPQTHRAADCAPLARRTALLRIAATSATAWLAVTPAAQARESAQEASRAGQPLPVVASFSILADFVRQVGGPQVDVTALVGPDGDAHAYSPSAQDAIRLKRARVLVVNGLDFENWLARLQKASGFGGAQILASQGVKALRFDADAHHDEDEDEDSHDHDHDHGDDHGGAHGHGHGHGAWDPHAWQSVPNARLYVRNIAQGLVQADPAHAAQYRERAAAYDQQLQQLDRDIRAAVAAIPPARRQLVTTHDAFGYFEKAYGIRFIGARGLANEAEPSAADIARLIAQIRADKIAAVFLENIGDPRLMQQLARESGAVVGGRLYSDALSLPGQPGETYIGMMRSNLRELSAALK